MLIIGGIGGIGAGICQQVGEYFRPKVSLGMPFEYPRRGYAGLMPLVTFRHMVAMSFGINRKKVRAVVRSDGASGRRSTLAHQRSAAWWIPVITFRFGTRYITWERPDPAMRAG
jgi:hypothetical protein